MNENMIENYKEFIEYQGSENTPFLRMLKKIGPNDLEHLISPQLQISRSKDISNFSGLPLSPGLAQGNISFQPSNKRATILVTKNLHQEHFQKLKNVTGIITQKTGVTSPGILLARSLGLPVVGLDPENFVRIGNHKLVLVKKNISSGVFITLDGRSGKIIIGPGEIKNLLTKNQKKNLLNHLNSNARNRVITFVGSSDKALQMNTYGYGLAIRSEDFVCTGPGQLPLFRFFIASSIQGKRQDTRRILEKLSRLQIIQYETVFQSNTDKPIIIRLFDPPFSEFFPSSQELLNEIVEKMEGLKQPASSLRRDIITLIKKSFPVQEQNPMLGHRGVRLAVTHPDLYRMQAKSLLTALARVQARGIQCAPHFVVPMIMDPQEFLFVKDIYNKEAQRISRRIGVRPVYALGAALETPRILAMIKEVARHADFLSFGTNDLTQLIFGLSRTDYQSFLPAYKRSGIIHHDPFQSIDPVLQEYIQQAVSKALTVNKKLSFFIAAKNTTDLDFILKTLGSQAYIVTSPDNGPFIALHLAKKI